MRSLHLSLIGMGTGNPDHLTLQAIQAMQRTDLLLLPRKADEKSDLLALRKAICTAHMDPQKTHITEFPMPIRDPKIQNYEARVVAWHKAIAHQWRTEIDAHADAYYISLLIWGDPSLYDSTLRIAHHLAAHFVLDIEVIAGITSIQAFTAAHNLSLNALSSPFMVTSARHFRAHGFPDNCDRLVVMLDSEASFSMLSSPEDFDIYWSAYAGMSIGVHISGTLSAVASQIIQTRKELRACHGWIMDIYLLVKKSI